MFHKDFTKLSSAWDKERGIMVNMTYPNVGRKGK